MPRSRLESAITKEMLTYLNSLPQCYAEKVHGGEYQAGRPDISGCYRGWALQIEVKRDGAGEIGYAATLADFVRAHATAQQASHLVNWQKAGAIVGVCVSVDQVKELIKRCD